MVRRSLEYTWLAEDRDLELLDRTIVQQEMICLCRTRQVVITMIKIMWLQALEKG